MDNISASLPSEPNDFPLLDDESSSVPQSQNEEAVEEEPAETCATSTDAESWTPEEKSAKRLTFKFDTPAELLELLAAEESKISSESSNAESSNHQAVSMLMSSVASLSPKGSQRSSYRRSAKLGSASKLSLAVEDLIAAIGDEDENKVSSILRRTCRGEPMLTLLGSSYSGVQTPIHAAVATGNFQIFRLLLESTEESADVLQTIIDCETKDFKKQTPLLIALAQKNDQIVELLLQNHACPNAFDGYGHSLLYLMCSVGNHLMVQKLINAGADLNIHNQNPEAHTPLISSIIRGDRTLTELLLSQGADPNVKCGIDQTSALQVAVQDQEDPNLVALLIEHGADKEEVDVQGYSLYDIALVLNKTAILQELKK